MTTKSLRLLFQCSYLAKVRKSVPKKMVVFPYNSVTTLKLYFDVIAIIFVGKEKEVTLEAKFYIPSTLNTDYLLWHTQLIVCAVKY